MLLRRATETIAKGADDKTKHAALVMWWPSAAVCFSLTAVLVLDYPKRFSTRKKTMKHVVSVKNRENWSNLIIIPLSTNITLTNISLHISCPVLWNDQTLGVMKNGQGPEALFRIQMFKFVGSSYTDVFLHCNVQICHNTGGVCQPVSSHRHIYILLKERSHHALIWLKTQ